MERRRHRDGQRGVFAKLKLRLGHPRSVRAAREWRDAGCTTIDPMLVEVLTFEGCPHGAAALQLARRVAAEAPGATEVRMLNVEMEQAEVVRFLGSPSIRVDGHDIEPGADARHGYSFGCRLHATADGLQPLPAEQWLRDALRVPSSPSSRREAARRGTAAAPAPPDLRPSRT